MSSLVNIHQDYLRIMGQLEESGGELTESMALELIKNLNESLDKVSNYCLVLDSLENEIAFSKAKIKEANEYVAKVELAKQKLEAIALGVVNSRGSKLIGVGGRWINKRKSNSLVVLDESLVPAIYMKVTTSIDRAEIKNDILKKGEVVPGCEIKENESLQWK